jgi:phosphoglycerate kinase
VFPDDYYITRKDINGPLEYCTAQAFPDDGIGITIGPHTLERYSKEIQRAKTVFLNGSMGFLERPETMEPLYTLLHTVAQSNAYSVIGGGESVTAVYQQGLEKAVTFCSTGGGATLAYITHTPLPGLAYM